AGKKVPLLSLASVTDIRPTREENSASQKPRCWLESIATPVKLEFGTRVCGAVTVLLALLKLALVKSITFWFPFPSDGITAIPAPGSAAAESGSSPTGACGSAAAAFRYV